ncbi:DUF3221 domain-containing protein [Bacillus sp. AGMB 02131]|uniref:DUF3221 domain-containing protein n=1 Tax=Peribacillus faecalis TaxID=2772559 RepID=A0A927CY12_9BACI|nr:DUF3221 domain-containing protein [Peribacillus faecalis]MBD3109753.1 DUF3221 domain-containing protein [Peribacillus faecalis]
MRLLKRLSRLLILAVVLFGFLLIDDILSSWNLKDEHGHVGYVIFNNGTAYFVQGEKPEPINYTNDYILHSERCIPGDAILQNSAFKIMINGIKSGDKVRIWYKEVLESYPARINVIDIEKIEE